MKLAAIDLCPHFVNTGTTEYRGDTFNIYEPMTGTLVDFEGKGVVCIFQAVEGDDYRVNTTGKIIPASGDTVMDFDLVRMVKETVNTF